MTEHERWMRCALSEARKGLGQTTPNPAVGAVLVAKGQIISAGHHRLAGEPHAEIECLEPLSGPVPKNATLYVTLEPCSTVGRTGPCTSAIIRAGVRRVVVGATDVNPLHNGRGIRLLQEASITVVVGILSDECAVLNEAFNKWILTRRPFVIAKCGMSLDGRLTRRPKESQWITSPSARRHARQLRAQTDAILIGAETLRADNPHLTVRGTRPSKQPWRVVLAGSGRLPREAQLFQDRYARRTLVYRNHSLDKVLRELGEKSVTSVVIEGGGNVLGQALDARLIDKIQIYFGPILTGGPVIAFPGRGASATTDSPRLRRMSYERIGQDICVSGYPIYGIKNSE